jgi:hypothetical protein
LFKYAGLMEDKIYCALNVYKRRKKNHVQEKMDV